MDGHTQSGFNEGEMQELKQVAVVLSCFFFHFALWHYYKIQWYAIVKESSADKEI